MSLDGIGKRQQSLKNKRSPISSLALTRIIFLIIPCSFIHVCLAIIFHHGLQKRPLKVMAGTLLSSVLGAISRAVATVAYIFTKMSCASACDTM